MVDGFELGKDWRDSYSFFGGKFIGDNPGSVWDEGLGECQISIRAKVLAAEDSYPEEWAALSDGHWGRTFEVPKTVALYCGYSEQLGEDQSEEEEEVEEEDEEGEDEDEEVEVEDEDEVEDEVQEEALVVVVEQEEGKKEEEEEVLVEEVKGEVKGKDDDQDGEPERKDEEDENRREGEEDEMAQCISSLAISR